MPLPSWFRAVLAEDWQQGGFGLYIHWPFCEAKCPYCDFNSHVRRDIDQSRWLRAYLSEIDRYAALLPERVLNTVFFGGGTPSLMDPEVVGAILERVQRAWPVANDLEVTLEANPGSVEAGRFRGYADAGVSRVSMGIQALNDTDLRRLGRIHSHAEAIQAFDIARKNFDRVSFDLIYARQDQSLRDWQAELREALAMAVDHLSLYQLTIEPGTAFGDRFAKGGLRGLPEDDLSADMYDATQELCEAAGMSAYEVSNHARPGAESRHNRIYWRYGDYAGIGPGAHGRITSEGMRQATETWSNPEKWLDAVGRGCAEKAQAGISPADQADEYLMMGLRLREGIDLDRHAALAGKPLAEERLDELRDLGMIETDTRHLRATAKGRPVLNAIIRALIGG
ncbi:MAG TPA: radical SAM family heme chaperone HemW [Roseovarius sp.]|nr:radical SAM family heme chaperone HemW [Roseovarius sp.]